MPPRSDRSHESQPQSPSRRPVRRESLWLDEVLDDEPHAEIEGSGRAAESSTRSPTSRRRATRRTRDREAARRRDPALEAAISRTWEAQVALLALLLLAVGGIIVVGFQETAPQFWLNTAGALLLFGLCFDLAARVLGATIARVERQPAWIALCAIGGSLAVLVHAAAFRQGPIGRPLRTVLGLFLLAFIVACSVATIVEPPQGP